MQRPHLALELQPDAPSRSLATADSGTMTKPRASASASRHEWPRWWPAREERRLRRRAVAAD
jgi:hypothetical protein